MRREKIKLKRFRDFNVNISVKYDELSLFADINYSNIFYLTAGSIQK